LRPTSGVLGPVDSGFVPGVGGIGLLVLLGEVGGIVCRVFQQLDGSWEDLAVQHFGGDVGFVVSMCLRCRSRFFLLLTPSLALPRVQAGGEECQ